MLFFHVFVLLLIFLLIIISSFFLFTSSQHNRNSLFFSSLSVLLGRSKIYLSVDSLLTHHSINSSIFPSSIYSRFLRYSHHHTSYNMLYIIMCVYFRLSSSSPLASQHSHATRCYVEILLFVTLRQYISPCLLLPSRLRMVLVDSDHPGKRIYGCDACLDKSDRRKVQAKP